MIRTEEIFTLYEDNVQTLQQLFLHYCDLEASDVGIDGSKNWAGCTHAHARARARTPAHAREPARARAPAHKSKAQQTQHDAAARAQHQWEPSGPPSCRTTRGDGRSQQAPADSY